MSQSKYYARKEDGEEISRLLESPAESGLVQVIYTRRPDAYESYMKESGESRVFVFRKENRIIGTLSEIIRDVYVQGERKSSAYLCGFKKDHDYNGLLPAGTGFFRALTQPDVDFYYCAVLSNNDDTLEKFGKKRGVIAFEYITEYTTYIINPDVKTKEIENSYTFRQAAKEDTSAILDFLNTEGRKKDLFPVVKSIDDYYNLHIEDFYILEDHHEIKACGAIWNVSDYKQFTVVNYKGIMKLARLFNPVLSLLKFVKLPKENEPLNFPMLSFFLSKDDDEDCYKIMFHKIKNEIKKNHEMFLVGLPHNHVIASVMKNLPKVTFESTIYKVWFFGQKEENISFDSENIYTESALL